MSYKGVIFLANQREINDILYPTISKYNSMLRVLIIIWNVNETVAQKIMKKGYQEFNILNNALLVLNYHASVFFCLYNPFDVDNNFYCPNVNLSNMREVLRNSRKFVHERNRNLHQFGLKVIST